MSHFPGWGQLLSALLFALCVIAAVRLGWWLWQAARHYEPNAVYQIDDFQGQLLRVGHAKDLGARMRGYVREAKGRPDHWWWDADPAVRENLWPNRHEWYHSEAVAVAKENALIADRQPPGNQVGTRHYGRPYQRRSTPAPVPAADPMEE